MGALGLSILGTVYFFTPVSVPYSILLLIDLLQRLLQKYMKFSKAWEPNSAAAFCGRPPL